MIMFRYDEVVQEGEQFIESVGFDEAIGYAAGRVPPERVKAVPLIAESY